MFTASSRVLHVSVSKSAGCFLVCTCVPCVYGKGVTGGRLRCLYRKGRNHYFMCVYVCTLGSAQCSGCVVALVLWLPLGVVDFGKEELFWVWLVLFAMEKNSFFFIVRCLYEMAATRSVYTF